MNFQPINATSTPTTVWANLQQMCGLTGQQANLAPEPANVYWSGCQQRSRTERSGSALGFPKWLVALSLACAAILTCMPQSAEAAIWNMPAAPSGVGGQDSITTSGGTRCRNAMNSNEGYLDVGVLGGQDRGSTGFNALASGSSSSTSVYARVVIPLGAMPPRLDCQRIMHLEIQRLESELEMLQFEQ